MRLERGIPRDWRAKVLLAGAIALGIGGTWVVLSLPDPIEAQLLPDGTEAPDFTLPDPEGRLTKLSSLRGKAVILNFMATWCGPCKGEISAFRSLVADLSEDPIVLLGVNVGETASRVANFRKANGVPYPLLVDESGEVAETFRVGAYPTTYFIDTGGIVRHGQVGGYSADRQGMYLLRWQLQKSFGTWLSKARKANKACRPAPTGPDPLAGMPVATLWLERIACACGCRQKLSECDCGEPRGGREMRLYAAPFCHDPDLGAEPAFYLLQFKYKAERVF